MAIHYIYIYIYIYIYTYIHIYIYIHIGWDFPSCATFHLDGRPVPQGYEFGAHRFCHAAEAPCHDAQTSASLRSELWNQTFLGPKVQKMTVETWKKSTPWTLQDDMVFVMIGWKYGAWLIGDPSILSVPTTVYHCFVQKSRLGALCNEMTLISISKSRKLVGLSGNFWEFTIQGGAPQL